mgnify:CR=1 FL=1
MQENRRIQGHLFGAFSVLVWGTTFVSTKVLLRAFTPLEIMVRGSRSAFWRCSSWARASCARRNGGMRDCCTGRPFGRYAVLFDGKYCADVHFRVAGRCYRSGSAAVYRTDRSVVLHENSANGSFAASFVRWRVSHSCRLRASVSCISARLAHCSA